MSCIHLSTQHTAAVACGVAFMLNGAGGLTVPTWIVVFHQIRRIVRQCYLFLLHLNAWVFPYAELHKHLIHSHCALLFVLPNPAVNNRPHQTCAFCVRLYSPLDQFLEFFCRENVIFEKLCELFCPIRFQVNPIVGHSLVIEKLYSKDPCFFEPFNVNFRHNVYIHSVAPSSLTLRPRKSATP